MIRCSYLEQTLTRPEIPSFFVQVLYYMMRSCSQPKERIHLYCVATCLVKMGLDIHETVSNEKEIGGQGMRSRQLSVLAGDYLSSLFYEKLADEGEVKGITRLSKAVCDVNEAKMGLYAMGGQREVSWSAYIQLAMRVQGGLLAALARFFCEEEARDSWEPLCGYLMLLHSWEAVSPERMSPWGSVPMNRVRSLAAETLQLARNIRPLEVRHDLLELIQNYVSSPLKEALVREG
ncbi:hypothetical protein CHM34_01605 [Paludifilum halophilum]|uniref:Heptaprenyl diphosphate synthase n=2 Tax=Paludifilum halophilum TaxID=1642702 RepID=A0A235BDG5_9BACL|nr:hypothetical protein CHM34_01605 [Paludifilum halophilum]